MPDNNGVQKKPFKVTISDEDYLKPDELDAMLAGSNQSHSAQNMPGHNSSDVLDVLPGFGPDGITQKPKAQESELPDPDLPAFTLPERPKFEVHIDDIDDDIPVNDLDEVKPDYKGEIYFSSAKPVRTAQPEVPQAKAKSKNQQKKKKSSYPALVVFLCLMLICTTLFSYLIISCVNDIIAFSKDTSFGIGRTDEVVTVTIPDDASTNDVIDILAKDGLVKNKVFCKLFITFENWLKDKAGSSYDKNPDYKSGVYYVQMDDGLETLLSEFKGNRDLSEETVVVSIPEGWTIYQIAERLEKFGVCSQSRFISSLKGTQYEYDFFKAIPDNSYRTFKLEGYLYPNTYEFYVDSDPNSVIRKFLDESESQWTDEYQKRADELGYTMDEIIIIASIIQREAANTDQMADISSVIHNRLNHPASWPTIGCDSTLNYITQYIKPNVTTSEASIYSNYYDSYSAKGLPPGPICNPGDDAIKAALYPNDTNYYFFRHDKNGKIYLARTQAEHDANASLVLKANNS